MESRINNYQIIKELGKGANGQVYLAIKDEDKKEYALKLQSEEVSENEIEIIKELSNYTLFNVVRSYDNFVYKVGFMEYYCIAMDYCNAGNLQTFLKNYRKQAELQDIKDIIFQIAYGIWELHQFKIIHRDIKPENLLMHIFDNRLFVKICDLGLSKIQKQGCFNTINIGTPFYMAPELIQNTESENYDSSVDIWALGAIIYDFFSEKQLFFGNNFNSIFNSIKNDNVKEKLNIITDCHLREICEQCLNKDSKKRPNIEQILTNLNQVNFESQRLTLNNDQPRLLQSQIAINKNLCKNNSNLNQEHTQQKLNHDEIRLQVQILKKIKDKKFANKLISMHSNQQSEDEVLKVLTEKGNQLIQISYLQD